MEKLYGAKVSNATVYGAAYDAITGLVSQLSMKEVVPKLAEAIHHDRYPDLEILWQRYKQLKQTSR